MPPVAAWVAFAVAWLVELAPPLLSLLVDVSLVATALVVVWVLDALVTVVVVAWLLPLAVVAVSAEDVDADWLGDVVEVVALVVVVVVVVATLLVCGAVVALVLGALVLCALALGLLALVLESLVLVVESLVLVVESLALVLELLALVLESLVLVLESLVLVLESLVLVVLPDFVDAVDSLLDPPVFGALFELAAGALPLLLVVVPPAEPVEPAAALFGCCVWVVCGAVADSALGKACGPNTIALAANSETTRCAQRRPGLEPRGRRGTAIARRAVVLWRPSPCLVSIEWSPCLKLIGSARS